MVDWAEERTMISAKAANMSFVCALFVVMIHTVTTATGNSSLWWFRACGKHFLCRMAVPFFFMVSGYFLAAHWNEPGWYHRAVMRRVRTLIIPFVVFALLWFAYEKFMTWLIYTTCGVGGEFGRATLLSVSGLNIWWLPHLEPLWYLRCLFILVCLPPLLLYVVSFRGWRGVCCLVVLFLAYGIIAPWTVSQVWPGGFWIYGLSMCGVFYFSLGAYLQIHRIHFAHISKTLVVCCANAAFVLLAAKLVASLLRWRYEYYFGWLAIPALIVLVWALIPARRWPAWMVASSFPIYLLHEFPLLPANRLSQYWFGASWCHSSVIHQLLLITVVIIVTMLLVLGLRKFVPWISSIMFGGR